MSRREKLFWLCIGAALIVLFLSIIPGHYPICEVTEKAQEKDCPSYQFVPFVAIKVEQILDRMGGVLTALATVAIAWFTLSLRQSTDKLWDAGERQLKLLSDNAAAQSSDMLASMAIANRSADISERALTELEAPFTAIKIIDTGLIKKTIGGPGHDFAILKFSITNDGRTPARLVELVDKTIFVAIGEGNPPPIDLGYRSRNTMPYGVISPPNSESQPFTRMFLQDHMNELAADTLILKTKAFFFYGFVRYETILKQTYRMGFCYMFDKFSERWILTGEDDYNYLIKENG